MKNEAKYENKIVLSNVGKIDPTNINDYIETRGYEAAKKIVSNEYTPLNVIDIIKNSGLRGRGGAGFPTGAKWEFTAKEKADKKFIVCNADEGEPGTFKDRLILEGDPHRILEGMIIAGYAVGAQKGFIYIRGEYSTAIERITNAIKDAYEKHYLGNSILGSSFNFDIEIKKGAGSYVCGEETSLIESIEGKRGNPRIKPPYPGQKGLWNYPTVVNNVETIANVAPILLNGADWFKSFGTEKSPGTKIFTLIGNVKNPGVVELPFGITLRKIIFGFGEGISNDKKLKAIHLGGTSGAVYDDSILDVPLDYDALKEKEGMLGSGAVLVMDEETDMRKYLKNVLEFFKHESCGQCVPCRIGTARLCEMAEEILEKGGKEVNIEYMKHLTEIMFKSSLCLLGQSVIMPVKSIFKYFNSEF